MKADMDEDSFAQEIMAEFKKMSGLIYKEFNRDIHMVKVPISKFNDSWTFTRSLDFGFAHKSALGYFAISPTKNEIYMFDGLYKNRLFESQIAEIVKEKDSHYEIVRPVADSAQPMSIAQLFHEGVRFDAVDKSTDSVKNGIVRVAELLMTRKDTGKPTLMFDKNLDWVADEFENYRWIQAIQDGVVKEVPHKVDDDAMDMVRYFAVTHTNRSEAEMFITPLAELKGRESFVIGESGTIPSINIKDFVGDE